MDNLARLKLRTGEPDEAIWRTAWRAPAAQSWPDDIRIRSGRTNWRAGIWIYSFGVLFPYI